MAWTKAALHAGNLKGQRAFSHHTFCRLISSSRSGLSSHNLAGRKRPRISWFAVDKI
jgi:hypothetical protein